MSPAPLHRIVSDDRRAKVVPLSPGPDVGEASAIETSAVTRRALQRRWLAASVAFHLLVVAALLFGLPRVTPLPPVPVLVITLAPEAPGGEGASGGGGQRQSAQPAAMASAPEAAPEPPRATTAQPRLADIPPLPETVPPQEIAPPEPLTPEPPSPPKPARAKLKPKTHHAEIVQETQPALTPDPPEPPAPVSAPQSTPATTATEAATVSPPASGIGAGAGTGGDAGPGKGIDGRGQGAIGADAGPGDEYLERLYRHLLRFKQYPPDAIAQKQQGAVEIGFSIGRDGTLGNAHIEKSSGFALIDDAAVAMLQRASPAPPLPESYKADEARARFTIDYKLSVVDRVF
jgi:periplasmic protein TonB